jgi:hypothetical protein
MESSITTTLPPIYDDALAGYPAGAVGNEKYCYVRHLLGRAQTPKGYSTSRPAVRIWVLALQTVPVSARRVHRSGSNGIHPNTSACECTGEVLRVANQCGLCA